MRILRFKVPRNFNIFLIGDEHVGTTLYSKSMWQWLLDMLESEYYGVSANFVVDHGDIADCISTRDRRYYPDEHKMPIREQERYAIELRKGFERRFLAILDGNHPFILWDIYGPMGGFTRCVADQLGIPYGTVSCKIHYFDKDDNLLFKSFHFHGVGTLKSTADDPIRRWSNIKLSLKRKLKLKAGDCLLQAMGHTHRLVTVKPQRDLYLVDDGKQIRQKYTRNPGVHPTGFIHYDHRWYANTGSFMKLYDTEEYISGYAERAGYDPLELGFVIARVRDGLIEGMDRVVYKQ